MAMGLAIPIAIQIGTMGDFTTSVALLPTFRGFSSTNLDQFFNWEVLKNTFSIYF